MDSNFMNDIWNLIPLVLSLIVFCFVLFCYILFNPSVIQSVSYLFLCIMMVNYSNLFLFRSSMVTLSLALLSLIWTWIPNCILVLLNLEYCLPSTQSFQNQGLLLKTVIVATPWHFSPDVPDPNCLLDFGSCLLLSPYLLSTCFLTYHCFFPL